MSLNSSEHVVCALFVGENEQDRLLVNEIFRSAGWRLLEAHNRLSALQQLERNSVQVVVAESDLRNWDWKSVLRDLRRTEHPPQLVVTSPAADDRLWSEVLNLGGYDVLLARPLDREEVRRVVASARRHYDVQPTTLARVMPASAFSVA